MVLTNSGIEKVFALNNQLKGDDELYNLIEVINFMEKDVNFQSFINELKSYRDSTIKLNTQMSSELNTTIEKMNSISQLIDQL